jgi:hypothetical protein
MALDHEELAEVITAWPLLSPDLRQAVLAIVSSAVEAEDDETPDDTLSLPDEQRIISWRRAAEFFDHTAMPPGERQAIKSVGGSGPAPAEYTAGDRCSLERSGLDAVSPGQCCQLSLQCLVRALGFGFDNEHRRDTVVRQNVCAILFTPSSSSETSP